MSQAAARTVRIAAQIQRSLALLLQRGLNDPRVGKVTVTEVTVPPDLSVARVRVVPFGAAQAGMPTAPDELIAGLRSAAGFLRGQLAHELRLRRAPRLEFELDRALVRAHELTELIDRTVAADARAAGPVDGGDLPEDPDADAHRPR